MAAHEKLRKLGIKVVTTGDDEGTATVHFVSQKAMQTVKANLKESKQ